MTIEEAERDWERRHAGLKEGDIYIGSDGHHHRFHESYRKDHKHETSLLNPHEHKHHHHGKSWYEKMTDGLTEAMEKHHLTARKRRQLLEKITFYIVIAVAIGIMAFVYYIYHVE